jgi:hypothetical protein
LIELTELTELNLSYKQLSTTRKSGLASYTLDNSFDYAWGTLILNTDAKHQYPKLIFFAILGTSKNIVTLPVVCEPIVFMAKCSL